MAKDIRKKRKGDSIPQAEFIEKPALFIRYTADSEFILLAIGIAELIYYRLTRPKAPPPTEKETGESQRPEAAPPTEKETAESQRPEEGQESAT